MFEELPLPLQEQIQNYLLENRFPEAKELYDQYLQRFFKNKESINFPDINPQKPN